ncbi:MAG: hypothetical protein ACI9JN_002801 [Bacteroidia bacterium]|jgi:hypothetical protein
MQFKTMKHITLALIMMLLTGTVIAQDTETKVIETKRVRIEFKNVNGNMDTIINEEISTVDHADALSLDSDTNQSNDIIRVIHVEDTDVAKEVASNVEEFEEEDVCPKLVETSMWVIDWGVNNWVSDNSVDVPAPYQDLKLENMSANFHLGIIQQGINLYRGHLRLVYGIGIEFNNYRFKEGVTITPDSKPLEYVVDDAIEYKRNKIVSRYATIPLMLNFKSNPSNDDKSFKVAAGIQAGYLIGAHQKQKWGQGKQKEKKKVKGDYGFEDYRIGYVAQFGYGDLVIYGKYYPTSTFKTGRGPEVNTACVGLVLTHF